jgi:hypothetical protein
MQRVMQAQAPLVNMPGFKEWSVMNFAVSMNRLKKAFLNGDEPPSAEDIKLWMRAFDVVLASTAEGKSSQDDVEQEKTETPIPETPPFSVNGHGANGTKEGVKIYE